MGSTAPIENDGSRGGEDAARTAVGGHVVGRRGGLDARLAAGGQLRAETAQPRRASPDRARGLVQQGHVGPDDPHRAVGDGPAHVGRLVELAGELRDHVLTAACLSRPARTSCSMTRPAPAEQMSHSTDSRISERG